MERDAATPRGSSSATRASTPPSAIPIFACALAGAVAAALVGLPLFQDGASYLFELVTTGSAVRHHRLSAGLLQLPAIVAHRLSPPDGGIALERTIFALGYALVPVGTLALSWAIVRRRRPGLIVWPVLVILLVNLVDFSWVSELLIAMQLAWPLALAWLVAPGTTTTLATTMLLVPVVWWLHPLAAALLATIALVCALVARREPAHRRAATAAAAAHALAAGARVLTAPAMLTAYEAGFLEPPEVAGYLFVSHWENVVVLAAALAIAALVAWPGTGREAERRRRAAAALAIMAGLVLVAQFPAPGHTFPLKTGLVPMTSMALMLLAAVDAGRRPASDEAEGRMRLALVLAGVFAAVVGAKCVVWHAATTRLHGVLAAGDARCRETDALEWLHTAPYSILDNWALPSLALVIQDRPPRRLLLAPGDCAKLRETGMVQIDPWTALPVAALVPRVD